MEFFKPPRLRYLYAASFVSTLSTSLASLSFSSVLFEQSRSHLQSAAIFAVGWVLPALVVRGGARLLARVSSKKLLVHVGFLQAISCLVLALALLPGLGVFVLFALRGYAEYLEKTARTVCIKELVPSETLTKAVADLASLTYLAIGTAAIACSFAAIGSHLTVTLFVAAGLAALAGLFSCLLPRSLTSDANLSSVSQPPSLGSTIALATRLRLWPLILALGACVALFQGFHNVARSAFGVQHLRLPSSALATLQIVSTSAIVTGAWLMSRISGKKDVLRRLTPARLLLATASAVAALLLPNSSLPGYILYFFFIILFEIGFVRFQSQLLLACPRELAAGFFAYLNASLLFGMAISVLLLAGIADTFGFTGLVCAVVAVAVTVVGFIRVTSLGSEFDYNERAIPERKTD